MPESAIETSSGPSLEQILWRAMDRFDERPALVDSEEFAAHIEGVFQGDVPAETWVARFFEGSGKLHEAPADVAEAIVRATKDRLAVYEIDVRKLEYVILEEKEKVVVVSDFGQFALRNDDVVGRAIEAAVIPESSARGGAGAPKAYLVRSSGEVVAVDVKKMARSLEQLLVRQVSMPAVNAPGARLAPFAPARRAMSEAREAKALRQDARTRQAMPAAPHLDRPGDAKSSAPAGAQTALFILMPDGTLVRPEMGSATRWQEMVGKYARTVGERAEARSEGLSAVRGSSASIRALGDDDLARALAAGARMALGLTRGDQFWVHPEAAFKPDEKALAQGGSGPGKGAVVSNALQLGEITGDPWADWALTGGGEMSPELMTALRGRSKHALRAALGRDSGDDMSIAPALADRLRGARGKELRLAGAQVVGFRAPDGSLVVQRGSGPIRLAAIDRPGGIDLRLPLDGAPLAVRSGAIPATALAALQMALEHTANAGGYRLPMLRIGSARDAQEVGAAMDLSSIDPRRTSVRLAGPLSIFEDGQVARLVLSMPFPNGGEVHVGDDLSEALQAYLGGSVQPAGGIVLRLRGGDAGNLASGGLDWGAMHSQAAQRAQDAVITLDLPMVQQLVAGSPSVSGLPMLLQRALLQAGDWTPGPGAQLPLGIRDLALRGPFDVPELAAAMPRPLNPGEEEIVIPMPLWAQMGRGQLSETDQIMSAPLSPFGHAPPMGMYRLVVPGGGPVDMTGGAPPGTPGIVDLLGPTGLEIVAHAGRGVRASSLGGRQFLGRVALDDGETAITGRGRIRVGAPDGGSFLSQGGGAPNSSPTIVAGAQPSMPNVPSGTYVDGTFNGAPMAGALTSAMQMSSEVAARTNMPGRPGAGDQTPADSAALGAQASSALADMLSASSRVASSSSTPSFITGLQPGMWSGHRRSATSNYQSWTYSSGHDDGKRSVGGVDLSSLSRPVYPSLPTSLRFRYIGAPLWWSSSTRLGGDDAGSPAGGAMRAGLRAATSAASIWRSILMSSPQWTSSAEDLSGGMDSGHEASAREMSSLSRRFESLASASLVGAGGAHGASASGAAYVAVDGSGAAGTMTRAAAARARAASIEMSIVAAIPPAPPPLESMGSGMSGGNAAHARGKGGQQNQHKEASDAVSHSKIEGSVDAIAQRIYHRIRRRIQSDRERFGG